MGSGRNEWRAAPVLQTAEHDLDAAAAPVATLVVSDRVVARSAARDAGLDALGFQGVPEPVGVITTVAKQPLCIYEALIEGYKHDVRNCWWIVGYNRQSLDHTTADRMFRRFDDIFETCGWRVVTLKHGKLQQAAFGRPGGQELADWIEGCPNVDFAVLTYQGGAAWRARLEADLAGDTAALALVAGYDDEALAALMTNLGGHCPGTLVEAFDGALDERPTLFIAYTIKGYGLPLAGHKDNHAGLMNPGQIAGLRQSLGIEEGDEWAPYGGLGDNAAAALKAFVRASAIATKRKDLTAAAVAVPSLAVPDGAEQSTQAAFGRILLDLAKSGAPLADRIVTTSPDVTVSTNLGAWVNQRGLFRRQALADVFAAARIPSAQKWSGHEAGSMSSLVSPSTTCS